MKLWMYTGDGSYWVAGKNPDYYDGGWKVVELYGGPWHSKEEEKTRKILEDAHSAREAITRTRAETDQIFKNLIHLQNCLSGRKQDSEHDQRGHHRACIAGRVLAQVGEVRRDPGGGRRVRDGLGGHGERLPEKAPTQTGASFQFASRSHPARTTRWLGRRLRENVMRSRDGRCAFCRDQTQGSKPAATATSTRSR